jgi:hypothetical protein
MLELLAAAILGGVWVPIAVAWGTRSPVGPAVSKYGSHRRTDGGADSPTEKSEE